VGTSLIVFCSHPRTYFAVGTGLLFEKDRSVTLGSSMLLNFLGLQQSCLCLGIGSSCAFPFVEFVANLFGTY